MYNKIEIICIVAGVLISIVSLIQSGKSNKLSKKATKLSENANKLSIEALSDSQKEYLPIIVFQDEISIVKKDFITLCNEITFDFDKKLLSGEKNKNNEYVCICAKIKNIGDGLLTGMQIREILIKCGNYITNDYRYPFSDEDDILLEDDNCNLWQHFILSKEDKEININFILTHAVLEYKEFDFPEEAEQYIVSFLENNNITIYLSLKLLSVNHSKYTQDFLASTFLDKKVVRNSFNDLRKSKR